ncbi:hypothetical protein MKZ38_009859 [Zalerion maritima]|uniref:CCAAT-binding factor domain-containing protein n=1 Tax=Zalerion maritima TaxID=339359 RepID=A0AAD5RFY7_9PEZI|nr:hypothetical protein MKZ38_009859 [Zalerion maritima]
MGRKNVSKRDQLEHQDKQQMRVPRKRKHHEQQRDRPMRQPNKKQQRNTHDSKTSAAKDTALIDEIKALGGDEDDLELITATPSDSEQEAISGPLNTSDNKISRDFAEFAQGLGFEYNKRPVDADLEDEDEGNSEVGGDDGDYEPQHWTRVNDAGKPGGRKGASTIIEPRPEWFHHPAASNLAGPSRHRKDTDDNPATQPPTSEINALKSSAKSMWEEDAAEYVSSRAASSSHKFLSTIMSSGTMSDKVSALTLAIQESPIHNGKALETLISMASKRSRSQALVALSALVDLFGPGLLLPSDRRLRRLDAQPGLQEVLRHNGLKSGENANPLPQGLTNAHLVCWVFEDWLKEAYFKTIQLLETWLNDEVDHSRSKALDFVYTLLREKPEQESNLLRLLVNKLGDAQKKIASRASYLLLQLLDAHPAMKTVVIKSVQQEVLLRPSQSTRAKYYAITTLNQTVLSYKEPEIAHLLQDVYFSAFLSILKKNPGPGSGSDASSATIVPSTKNNSNSAGNGRTGNKGLNKAPGHEQPGLDSDDKLVSALLTGVNRAVPFSNSDSAALETHMDTLFRIAHSSNFNTSIQALMLIQQISSRGVLVDRFYKTLYESLLDPRLVASSKQTLYLNLLFKSLKTDPSTRRIKAFIKRMVQVASLHQPSFICGVIYLVCELQTLFPDLVVLMEEPETNEAEEGAGDSSRSYYDGRKRDPEFSNAHESCLWEVLPYQSHFHPSVSLFASGLLSNKKGLQNPELSAHTLIHFLDRFVFRNPKTTESSRGASIMQPTASIAGTSNLLASNKITSSIIIVNAPEFWNKQGRDVAAEDAFFHNYFSYAGKKNQPEKQKKQEEAAESGEDDENDEEDIWNALVSSRPELGEAEDDKDSLGSDLGDLNYSDSDVFSDEWGVQAVDDGDDGEDAGEEIDMNLDSHDSDNSDISETTSTANHEGKHVLGVTTAKVARSLVDGNKDLKMRRKLMKNLPVFASAEEYEDLLGIEDGLTG